MATGREREAEALRRQEGLLAQNQANRAAAEAASLASQQAGEGPSESGLITGRFARKNRQERERAAGAVASEAASALGTGRAQTLVQASGVDFRKIPPDVAAGITALLADPETRAAGMAELQ